MLHTAGGALAGDILKRSLGIKRRNVNAELRPPPSVSRLVSYRATYLGETARYVAYGGK